MTLQTNEREREPYVDSLTFEFPSLLSVLRYSETLEANPTLLERF